MPPSTAMPHCIVGFYGERRHGASTAAVLLEKLLMVPGTTMDSIVLDGVRRREWGMDIATALDECLDGAGICVILVTDMWLPEHVDAVRERGGMLIKVLGPPPGGAEAPNPDPPPFHLASVIPDYTVDNTVSLDSTCEQLKSIVKEEGL